ncbi:MAG: hypothetical protein ACN0LA_09955 [Candidatus Longimicrobiales bacterium M2_2A_002]
MAEFAANQPPSPEVVNGREAAALDAPTRRTYRGRVYRVDPIPYKAGLELQELVGAYGQASSAREQERALEGMVRLYRRLAVPTGWRRLVRWFLPNPFRHATEKEIIALADFFWTCRTGRSLRDSVRAAGERRPSTASTGSTNSSGSTAGGRRPGATTSTA